MPSSGVINGWHLNGEKEVLMFIDRKFLMALGVLATATLGAATPAAGIFLEEAAQRA